MSTDVRFENVAQHFRECFFRAEACDVMLVVVEGEAAKHIAFLQYFY